MTPTRFVIPTTLARSGWMIPAALLCPLGPLERGVAAHPPAVDELVHMAAGVSSVDSISTASTRRWCD